MTNAKLTYQDNFGICLAFEQKISTLHMKLEIDGKIKILILCNLNVKNSHVLKLIGGGAGKILGGKIGKGIFGPGPFGLYLHLQVDFTAWAD